MKLLSLIKKEFYRFFHDPRLIVTVLLPGLIIFLLYNVIGSIASDPEPVHYDYTVCVAGSAGSEAYTQAVGEAVKKSGSSAEFRRLTAEEGKAAVERGEADACLVFSEDFNGAGGSVEIWYDGASDAGSAFYGVASAVLQASAMRFSVIGHDLESAVDLGKSLLAGLLPFLVVTLIFSACMSLTLESVAGEKERGTLATILATSVKRHEIALGKIIPLSCISALGAASSFLGVALSLPKLMGMEVGSLMFSGYTFGHYAFLFLLIISVVPLIVSAIGCISAFSRSVKEASAYTSVLMIFLMIVSILSAFLPSIGDWYVAVPVLNAVVSMEKTLGGELAVWQSLVSVGANLVYTALLVFFISKMLSSERIMFGK